MASATIGWSPDLGRGGEKPFARIHDALSALADPDVDIVAIDTDLTDFYTAEQRRVSKLEKRLGASETGILRTQKLKNLTAEMLNNAMRGHPLPEPIVSFLHGVWFQSPQLILINRGLASEHWQRANPITETMIWTFQPIAADNESEANRQKLYTLIERLPREINDLLIALEHSSEVAEAELAAIEVEHVKVLSGTALDYVDFPALPCDSPIFHTSTSVSKALLKKVHALTEDE